MLLISNHAYLMYVGMPTLSNKALGLSQLCMSTFEQLKVFMAGLQGDCMASFGIFGKLLNGRNFSVYNKKTN